MEPGVSALAFTAASGRASRAHSGVASDASSLSRARRRAAPFRSPSSRRRPGPHAACAARCARAAPSPRPPASSRRPAAICCCRRPDGGLAGVLFALESADDPLKDPFRPGALADAAAGRRLPLRQCAARCAARGARHRARQLPLHPLPQGRAARTSGSSCPRASTATTLTRIVEGVCARARPDQHAGERHGPGRARIRRARAGDRSTAPACSVIVGDDLLEQNFPLIHAVGRAAATARRA